MKNLTAEVKQLRQELSKSAKVTVANAAKYGEGLQTVSQQKVHTQRERALALPESKTA